MVSTQICMLLAINVVLLNYTNFFLHLINFLLGYLISLLLYFRFVDSLSNLLLCPFIDIKLFSEYGNSLITNLMIMYKPIKIISINGSNVIIHTFPKTFIIGNNKQVDHYHITKFQFIDNLWNCQVTKSI